MKLYLFDDNGMFVASVDARTDPLDNNRHLVPKRATAVAPEVFPSDGEGLKWSGKRWELSNAPKAVEIFTALASLDTAAIRPTRAILAAQLAGVTPDEADTARLAEIEEQAKALRDELAGLDGITEE